MSARLRAFVGAPLASVVVTLALFTATPAHASAIYTYMGSRFTNITLSGPASPTVQYTTDDRVTGFIELAGPLVSNLPSLTTIAPLSFSFSDGVNTITSVNATSGLFRVATDGDGKIVAWNVILNIYAPEAGGTLKGITMLNNVSSFSGDVADDTLCDSQSSAGACLVELPPSYSQTASTGSSSPGTWQRQVPPVPEPSSMALIGLALAGFAARRRVR